MASERKVLTYTEKNFIMMRKTIDNTALGVKYEHGFKITL